MDNNQLRNQAIHATKWSTITELLAKIVVPISNMVLARLLVPEAFGVVALVTMVVSFAEMFTDSGFQKYLIQHEFEDDNEKFKSANVAFITNFGISIIFVLIITIFRDSFASLVGNPDLGIVLALSSSQLLLSSFSSIQIALFRRSFDFKSLFIVRIISIFIPFFITLPLAFLGFSYWSIIIGSIFTQFITAVLLTIKSKWKPSTYFSWVLLKEMFSFSVWSLIEAISIWATSWIDVFLIGTLLNQYFLGLYRTSQMMVNSIFSVITAALVPVLFSTLSRLNSDEIEFKKTYFQVQRFVSIFVFPLGIGIFLYRNSATQILLGNQWMDASEIIGIWALTSSFMIVLGHFCSEVYRSKGKPRLSFVAQLLHIIFLIPTIIISSKYGFWALVYARSLIRFQAIVIHFIFMKYFFGFKIFETIKNILPSIISAIFMGIFGLLVQQISTKLIWEIISIILCGIIYFLILFSFSQIRMEFKNEFKKLLPSKHQK